MAGVRVRHETKRSGFFVISDPTRPYQGWQNPTTRFCRDCTRILGRSVNHPPEFHVCPTCTTVHTHKTYHILLNSEGSAVVSPAIHAGLKRAGAYDMLAGLSVEAEVAKPPALVLGRKDGMMAPVPQRDQITVYHE